MSAMCWELDDEEQLIHILVFFKTMFPLRRTNKVDDRELGPESI